MGTSEDGGFSLVELFVAKFVLADVIIIAALLFAGPIYAVAITALLVVSTVLVWYLAERVGRGDEGPPERERESAAAGEETDTDPVTTLQQRYASGELTETEFERKLDQLLDADERAERAGVETEQLSLDREG